MRSLQKGSLHLSLILSIILYFVLDPISSLFSNSGNLTDKHARLSLLECARSITGDVKAENCGQRNKGKTLLLNDDQPLILWSGRNFWSGRAATYDPDPTWTLCILSKKVTYCVLICNPQTNWDHVNFFAFWFVFQGTNLVTANSFIYSWESIICFPRKGMLLSCKCYL